MSTIQGTNVGIRTGIKGRGSALTSAGAGKICGASVAYPKKQKPKPEVTTLPDAYPLKEMPEEVELVDFGPAPEVIAESIASDEPEIFFNEEPPVENWRSRLKKQEEPVESEPETLETPEITE
jgi:hypothetical protein